MLMQASTMEEVKTRITLMNEESAYDKQASLAFSWHWVSAQLAKH
jgi:hypothetical protein